MKGKRGSVVNESEYKGENKRTEQMTMGGQIEMLQSVESFHIVEVQKAMSGR